MQNQWTYQLPINHSRKTQSLREYLTDYLLIPKHLVSNLRKDHRVLVDQKYLPMNFSLADHHTLDLTFNASDFKLPYTHIQPIDQPVQVLYEDPDLIVVNKNRGDKTHPNQPNENQSTFNYTAGYLANQNELPYMVHRLDQQTSGAIIFGKNPVVVPMLNQLIFQKKIKRTYLAWVHGAVNPARGTIDLPIGRDLDDQRKRKINGDHAVPAITHYQVIKQHADLSLVKIELETGRTHQIRVHFQAIGHPLVGDPLYSNDQFSKMLLHSWQLELIHPLTMQTRTITAPIPKEFALSLDHK